MLTELVRTEDIIDAKYDSSNISSSKFEIDTDTLYITFIKGNMTYKFLNVDPIDYTTFQNAESTGKAFIESIKSKYKGEKI